MKFKKSFISLVVMTAVVGSSYLNAMKRVGGQAANVVAKGAALSFAPRSFGNDSPWSEKTITPVNKEISDVMQGPAERVLKTRMDGYREVGRDIKQWVGPKLPDYDYAGFKKSTKFAGKAGAAGALAGGLAVNYYLEGGDEAKFQRARLQMKAERQEHFSQYQELFDAAPQRAAVPVLLQAYYKYIELLDRKELEDEYRGGVDQFIQLKEKEFNDKWGRVLRRSVKDDELRDSQKHDMHEEFSQVSDGLSLVHQISRERIISYLLTVKKSWAEVAVQQAEASDKLLADTLSKLYKNAYQGAANMANESAQAMKKRGSKIVKGSASAIQSGVSNLADQYYQAAKAGVSSTWDWVAKKDKEAEQELAKI